MDGVLPKDLAMTAVPYASLPPEQADYLIENQKTYSPGQRAMAISCAPASG